MLRPDTNGRAWLAAGRVWYVVPSEENVRMAVSSAADSESIQALSEAMKSVAWTERSAGPERISIVWGAGAFMSVSRGTMPNSTLPSLVRLIETSGKPAEMSSW